jgi:hypothetical protein
VKCAINGEYFIGTNYLSPGSNGKNTGLPELSATVIRNLLLRNAAKIDPRGIRIQSAVGIDLGLPLVGTSAGSTCEINSSSVAGQSVIAAGWVMQGLCAGLVAIVIAGYGGLVKRR